MKTIILCLICLSCFTTQAQNWFDKSCKNIDDSLIAEEFNTSDERNILKIIINQAGDLVINEVEKPNITEIKFKEYVLDFVTNPKGSNEKAAKPEKVIVQLDSYQKDNAKINNYKSYVYDVYLYLWDQKSNEKYSDTYMNLNCKKREKIFNAYPLKIIGKLETKEKTNTPKRGIGVPDFGGDTVDN